MIRAYARVLYSPAGTPAVTVRKGCTAPVDTATGRATFTLTRAIDRTEGCVIVSFVANTSTPPQVGGSIDADLAAADTTLEVRVRGSTGVLADPLAGTGYAFCVLDDDEGIA